MNAPIDLPGLSELFQEPWTLLVASSPEPVLHLYTGDATFFWQALNICLKKKIKQNSHLVLVYKILLTTGFCKIRYFK